jgi:hypothetical protein
MVLPLRCCRNELNLLHDTRFWCSFTSTPQDLEPKLRSDENFVKIFIWKATAAVADAETGTVADAPSDPPPAGRGRRRRQTDHGRWRSHSPKEIFVARMALAA